jgi:maltooligosyltrehalose trehalohydrolase
MPVAQFPGQRNWGYDGVYPFAVQNSYGGARGLKRFVNAAHAHGLAVVLDVVYNHLGPEGNYLSQFGPYFTNRYQTPWGDAVNFDDEQSTAVRRYVVENALQWVDEFHIDGLRLDAVHAIYDGSATHILMDIADAVHQRGRELGRQICVIAESDLNDARIVRKRESEGYGLDAQWCDDFHHSLHCMLTGETAGYYCDFGRVEHLARTYANGFAYAGQYSDYRGRPHGTSTEGIPGPAFVVCSQNHDQVGNRMLGERLTQLIHFQDLKLAAGAILLSPFVPLLFMGQEYAENAPFLYFVSHSDPDLIEAVRNGRRQEFAAFEWAGEVPDPQSEETFYRSRLSHDLRQQPKHAILLQFYKELIQLRKRVPALADLNRESLEVYSSEKGRWLCLRRWSKSEQVVAAFHFSDEAATIEIPAPRGRWVKVFDSAEERWLGDGTSLPGEVESAGKLVLPMAAKSFAVFETA